MEEPRKSWAEHYSSFNLNFKLKHLKILLIYQSVLKKSFLIQTIPTKMFQKFHEPDH